MVVSLNRGFSIRVNETKLAAIRSSKNCSCYSNSGLGLQILQITYQNESEIIASAWSMSRSYNQCSFGAFYTNALSLDGDPDLYFVSSFLFRNPFSIMPAIVPPLFYIEAPAVDKALFYC